MNPNAKEILNAKVIRVENFQGSNTQIGTVEALQWTADFHLSGGQSFHVQYNPDGYLYAPISEQNKLTDLKQILWTKHKMGFGGRGCGFDPKVQLIDGVADSDKKAYEQILTPVEIDEGRWVPYPDYRYVPMLSTAFEIRYAYAQKLKFEKIAQKANHNFADALALERTTYDLRQYA